MTSEVGLIEVLCIGPRRDSEIYDMAVGIANSGLLADDEVTKLWEALALLDVAVESVGLEGWDYRPAPALEGLRRAAVAAGRGDGGLAGQGRGRGRHGGRLGSRRA